MSKSRTPKAVEVAVVAEVSTEQLVVELTETLEAATAEVQAKLEPEALAEVKASKAPRYILSEKAFTARKVATKQRPAEGHGANWRAHAVTDQSMRSQVMDCLIGRFGTETSFTVADAVQALKDNAVPTGNRSHSAYGTLLVKRGYIVPADDTGTDHADSEEESAEA